jgi:TonB family protein
MAAPEGTVLSQPAPPRIFAEEIDSGAIKQPKTPAAEPSVGPVQPPPVVASGGSLPINLPAEAVAPRLSAPQISTGATPARLVRKVNPTYPRNARNAEGKVVLFAVIDVTGKPTDIKVVSGDPVLGLAAIAAFQQWRYEPATLSGKTVASQATVEFTFAPR